MIVGTCGFGNTGASAVLDYLRGYTDINIFDKFEFQLLHQADGICDLKYHLTQNRERIACNAAISRFIWLQKNGTFAVRMRKLIGEKYDVWYKEYISELIQISWKGEHSAYDPVGVIKYHNRGLAHYFEYIVHNVLKRIRPLWHFPPYQTKYFSLMGEDEFIAITKEALGKLFSLLEFDKFNITILDMAFSVTNPSLGMEYFDDSKVIIVIRDPRDVYVSAKLHPEDSRFMPNDDAKKYCFFYKKMREYIVPSDNILVVQYEDLIYKYEETTMQIREFLELDNRPDKEFTFFDPTVSVKYTQRKELYTKYPHDVELIENELREYLYDFSKVVSPLENQELIKMKNKFSNTYKGLKQK